MLNSFRLFTLFAITVTASIAFGFGGPQCRAFKKATAKYFQLFYQTQDDKGAAHCKANSDCILSARGPCNQQAIASKLKLNTRKIKSLERASKQYEELFSQCAIEVCDKTRVLATSARCTEGRCEFIYE